MHEQSENGTTRIGIFSCLICWQTVNIEAIEPPIFSLDSFVNDLWRCANDDFARFLLALNMHQSIIPELHGQSTWISLGQFQHDKNILGKLQLNISTSKETFVLYRY